MRTVNSAKLQNGLFPSLLNRLLSVQSPPDARGSDFESGNEKTMDGAQVLRVGFEHSPDVGAGDELESGGFDALGEWGVLVCFLSVTFLSYCCWVGGGGRSGFAYVLGFVVC